MARAHNLRALIGALLLLASCGNDSRPSTTDPPTDAGPDSLGDVLDPEAGGPAQFGRACSKPEHCGPELMCVGADSIALESGGPPKGWCTRRCDEDRSVCEGLPNNALCIPFGQRAYCAEGCEYGPASATAFNPRKCQGRLEFACQPAFLGSEKSCDRDSDCEKGERCDGTCRLEVPACLPRCNGDFDCPAGRFCNPRTGECVDDVPSGSTLGASCEATADTEQCRGACRDEAGRAQSRCAEECTLGAYPGCGSATSPALAGCAIPGVPEGGFGDIGRCAWLCDCNDECPFGLSCIKADAPYLNRPGYCKERAASEEEIVCPVGTGGGGSGGGAGAGADGGMAGEGGQGGAP